MLENCDNFLWRSVKWEHVFCMLFQMLADRPEGIWASQLPFLYKVSSLTCSIHDWEILWNEYAFCRCVQCLKWTVAQSPNVTNISFGRPKAAPN